MLQNMDHIEASCVFYVEAGTLNRLEQSKIWVFTVTTLEIAMLTVHHDLMLRVCIRQDPRDVLRHTSADVLSDRKCKVFITPR